MGPPRPGTSFPRVRAGAVPSKPMTTATKRRYRAALPSHLRVGAQPKNEPPVSADDCHPRRAVPGSVGGWDLPAPEERSRCAPNSAATPPVSAPPPDATRSEPPWSPGTEPAPATRVPIAGAAGLLLIAHPRPVGHRHPRTASRDRPGALPTAGPNGPAQPVTQIGDNDQAAALDNRSTGYRSPQPTGVARFIIGEPFPHRRDHDPLTASGARERFPPLGDAAGRRPVPRAWPRKFAAVPIGKPGNACVDPPRLDAGTGLCGVCWVGQRRPMITVWVVPSLSRAPTCQ